MAEKLKGPTHDDVVPPLNSVAMIDGYRGRMTEAETEIARAEQIARLPDHGVLLDQVLVNVADIAMTGSHWERASALLDEARRRLETAYPLAERPTEAWRYAIWDTVDAELLAHQGDAAAARKKITAAVPLLTKRFGAKGFYVLLADRRSRLVEQEAASSSRTGR
jgi:hypothetical protein